MQRDVYLYGEIGRRFGRHWRLEIDSPAEAVRALCTLRPGIEQPMRGGQWRVIVGTPHISNAIELQHLHMNAGQQAIHIVPATQASGSDEMNIGKIIVGTALVVASFWSGPFAPLVMSLGLSLVFGGIAGLLTPGEVSSNAPQATDLARPEDRPSFLFSGVTNNTQQGGPVPVVIGTHLVGSVLVSGSIVIEDIAA